MILQDGLWNVTVIANNTFFLLKRPQDPLSPPVRGTQVAVVDRVTNMVIVHVGLTTESILNHT